MGIIGFAVTVVIIIGLIAFIIWGIPRLPQPGQWMVIAFLIVVAVCVLAAFLTGNAHISLPLTR